MLRLAIIFALCFILCIQAKLRVDTQWPGGFQGGLEIPITKNIKDGWEVELVFKNAVQVDIFEARFKSQDNNTRYRFVNKFWNEQQTAGSTLHLTLLTMSNASPTSLSAIYFNGEPVKI